MSILKDIPELVSAEVISQETADRIHAYYHSKGGQNQSRLLIVFGILGSLLVGLGIILIIAHNWDELSKATKTLLAFVPLVIGQTLCGYTLLKKQDSTAFRESSSAFLFIAIAANISLIAQIYNISGDFNRFLLTWMLLGLPLVYLMRSSAASLFYIAGITYYAGHWSYSNTEFNYYWLLLVLIVPHYYLLFKRYPYSNFMVFHNWLIPISMLYGLFPIVITGKSSELMIVAYSSILGLYCLIGNSDFFNSQKIRNSSYKIIGTLGTVIVLLTLSFDFFWSHLRIQNYQFSQIVTSQEFLATAIVTLVSTVLFILDRIKKPLREIKVFEPIFILFAITFIIGLTSPFAVVLDNILVLGIGIFTIRDGAKSDHLGVMNYGLLIITALVVCRFFDTHWSFVTRGILFLIVGVGFFLTNFLMLKKRKVNE